MKRVLERRKPCNTRVKVTVKNGDETEKADNARGKETP